MPRARSYPEDPGNQTSSLLGGTPGQREQAGAELLVTKALGLEQGGQSQANGRRGVQEGRTGQREESVPRGCRHSCFRDPMDRDTAKREQGDQARTVSEAEWGGAAQARTHPCQQDKCQQEGPPTGVQRGRPGVSQRRGIGRRAVEAQGLWRRPPWMGGREGSWS